MKRKECFNSVPMTRVATLLIAAWLLQPHHAAADTVRIWPTAVVSGEKVTLGDVCSLTLLRSGGVPAVESGVVAAAPPPGGSMTVTAERVQDALRRAGVNLAHVVLAGATHCDVTRPRQSSASPRTKSESGATDAGGATLRDAVVRVFDAHARSAGGRIDLRFGRTKDHALELTSPNYTFEVRVRGGRWLGSVIKVDADVLSDGEKVRTVYLVVSASLHKRVVVATRAINLKAPIRPEDVELAVRSYDALEELGASDLNGVIGQRARRFIPAGRSVRPSDLESMPLVKKGQLVDVSSLAGGIEVRSVGKAASSGGLGDIVEVVIGDRRGERVTGVVAGERRVVIGTAATRSQGIDLGLALGTKSGN